MIDIAEFPPDALHYTMTLFVTGATRLSLLAVANVRDFCETELAGNYELEVVDLYRTPERARSAQVIAAPTLDRNQPGRLAGLSATCRTGQGYGRQSRLSEHGRTAGRRCRD